MTSNRLGGGVAGSSLRLTVTTGSIQYGNKKQTFARKDTRFANEDSIPGGCLACF